MKTQTRNIKMALVASTALCSLLLTACNSGNSGFSVGPAPAGPAPTLAPFSVPGSNTSVSSGVATNAGVTFLSNQGGAAVVLVPDSQQTAANYAFTHPLINPTDFALSVNLANNGSGYGGTIMITYNDQGQWFPAKFETGAGSDSISGHDWYTGMDNAAFNQWFTYNGATVFHAFFQDGLGSVVLVLDTTSQGLGDGLASGTYNGSIWFKNFLITGAVQSSNQCWFIEIGPFDCQTFMVGGKVQTTSALYPSTADGYQRLGTFTNLNINQAFNQ